MISPARDSLRGVALRVLYDVEVKGAYANLALREALSSSALSRSERALVTELVYGVERRKGTLDWVIQQFSSRPLSGVTPWVRNILRLGTYQCMFMRSVPEPVACNESVELAKVYGHPGTVRFVNGLLRALVAGLSSIRCPDLTSDPVAHIEAKYSHPAWIVERWVERFGVSETIELCKANNEIPPVTVRTNLLKATRDELKARFEAEGVIAEASSIVPEGLRIRECEDIRNLTSYGDGLFYVQDESSMLVAHVVSPLPGEVVVDACAAPGGKSTHMAELMQNRGEILSCDIHEHRLALMMDSCRRLGIGIVRPVLMDARELPVTFKGIADRCLVDAPCSGLGALRRRPDLRWRKSPSEISALHNLQLEILSAASKCLRPGGVLVYSTCSTEPEENEAVVIGFLKRETGFELVDAGEFRVRGQPLMELCAREGCTGEPGGRRGSLIQLYPHIHGTDGFFISRIQKNGI